MSGSVDIVGKKHCNPPLDAQSHKGPTLESTQEKTSSEHSTRPKWASTLRKIKFGIGATVCGLLAIGILPLSIISVSIMGAIPLCSDPNKSKSLTLIIAAGIVSPPLFGAIICVLSLMDTCQPS